jgi:hypothetical protein
MVKVYYLSFYGKFNDFLWDSVNITIWTACELNIGIFAASIATLRPLFRRVFQGSQFSTGGYTDNEKYQNSLGKNGFVKHISNSRGTSKIGESGSGNRGSDGFEMFSSVVTANRMQGDNESEESILPMQKPLPMGIRKTTEVTVNETQMRKVVEGRA